MLCGVDEMIFKTNENLGGDTITYTLEHITTDGRIYHREIWLTQMTRPIEKFPFLGLGTILPISRSMGYSSVDVEIERSRSSSTTSPMEEILSCFDFSRGIFPENREAFLQNPSYSVILSNLHLAVADYCAGRGLPSTQINAVHNLQDLLISTLEGRWRVNGFLMLPPKILHLMLIKI